MNQRAIAAKLGISQTTVSRALKGNPLVQEGTRRKIEAMAGKIGYKTNPLVVTLMEQIRSGKKSHERGTIAVVHDAESRHDKKLDFYTFRQQRDGFRQMAERWGFRTEDFYRRAPGMSDEALDRILYTRGISGLILAAPASKFDDPPSLDWSRYATATVSYVWSRLTIDRASTDHRQNVSIAMNNLIARGYTRIGLILPADAVHPRPRAFNADNPWLGGYLHCQCYLPTSERLPVFFRSRTGDAVTAFRRWLRRCKPDALLCLVGEELELVRQAGLDPREDMPLVCLNRPAGSAFAGIEEQNTEVGRLTCEIVINHIVHNEFGLPTVPRLLLVPGTWVDGETLLPRKPTKRAGATGRQKPKPTAPRTAKGAKESA